MKLTKAQRAALQVLTGDNFRIRYGNGLYMPTLLEDRTFIALERRALAEYVTVDQGHPRNGYRITPAGRALLTSKEGHGDV